MFFSYITSPFCSVGVLDLFRFNYLMNSKYGFSIQFCIYGVNCGKSLCACERSRYGGKGERQTRVYPGLHKDLFKHANSVTNKTSSR